MCIRDRVCTGILKPDSTIYNVNKDTEEKVGKLYLLRGKDTIEVPELRAGDIGAVAKLGVTQTGDTIARRSAPIVYHRSLIHILPMRLVTPVTRASASATVVLPAPP